MAAQVRRNLYGFRFRLDADRGDGAGGRWIAVSCFPIMRTGRLAPAIRATGAERFWVTHGYTHMVRWLSENGCDAER